MTKKKRASPTRHRAKKLVPARQFEFHPLADMFPLMEGEEFRALVEDMRVRKRVNLPIMLFEGKILDGRNRYNALVELGWEVPTRTFSGSHQKARDYVISANIHRRHLTNEQKRALIENLLKADPEKSDRQIAKEAKLPDHKLVGRTRKRLEGRGAMPHVAKRKDAAGRRQPSSKPKPALAEPPPAKEKPPVNAPDTGLRAFDGHVLRLLQIIKNASPQRHAKTGVSGENLRMLGDFLREVAAMANLVTPVEAQLSPEFQSPDLAAVV
jgi:hypothetical protein